MLLIGLRNSPAGSRRSYESRASRVNPHLNQLIAAKREWHYRLTPEREEQGFKGWCSRGYLPHFDAPGSLQFLTYRLHDAMPAARRSEWEALLRIEEERERNIRLEEYLDRGHGECHLRDPRVAAVVQENLLHHDGEAYHLLAWVVMPNHVHALIQIENTPLDQVLHSWKSYTASRANKVLGRTGAFWQREYFDRYMRDEEHLRKSVRYIENNPVKARLARTPEEWPWSSAALAAGAPAAVPARTDEIHPATVVAKLIAQRQT